MTRLTDFLFFFVVPFMNYMQYYITVYIEIYIFFTKSQSQLTINVFFSSQNQIILLLNVLGFTGRISGLHSILQWKELHLHCPTAGSAQRDSLTLPGERGRFSVV